MNLDMTNCEKVGEKFIGKRTEEQEQEVLVQIFRPTRSEKECENPTQVKHIRIRQEINVV